MHVFVPQIKEYKYSINIMIEHRSTTQGGNHVIFYGPVVYDGHMGKSVRRILGGKLKS